MIRRTTGGLSLPELAFGNSHDRSGPSGRPQRNSQYFPEERERDLQLASFRLASIDNAHVTRACGGGLPILDESQKNFP
jgi:hypothetical protein